MSSAGATSEISYAWSILLCLVTALALALTHFYVVPSLKGSGLVTGSFVSCLLITALHNDQWLSFFFQSIIIGASYVAFLLDTRLNSPATSHTNHHDHHHHQYNKAYPAGIVGASRLTNYILPKVQSWPLLHTILTEKDSRRIFYFMW